MLYHYADFIVMNMIVIYLIAPFATLLPDEKHELKRVAAYGQREQKCNQQRKVIYELAN